MEMIQDGVQDLSVIMKLILYENLSWSLTFKEQTI